jgi:hypothetical protein
MPVCLGGPQPPPPPHPSPGFPGAQVSSIQQERAGTEGLVAQLGAKCAALDQVSSHTMAHMPSVATCVLL